LGASLVYRSRLIYETLMLALYGRHYASRLRAVADLIPDGASVVELCCGPGLLFHRHLKAKGVDYTGLDLNPGFIAHARRHGGRGIVCDLGDDRPLPEADVVLMQAGLYQFLPDAAPVVRRMFAAARDRVIIAEPTRNLSTSRHGLLAALAATQTDAGLGGRPLRFDGSSLDALFEGLGLRPQQRFSIPGGREDVYVFDRPREASASPGSR
jgi:trans-aconitate methyltransferase